VEWLPAQVSCPAIPIILNLNMSSNTAVYIAASGGFLEWAGQLHESQTQGLSNGSLYDLLTSTYSESGTAQVSATAFNITCGYISGLMVETNSHGYSISFPSGPLNFWNPFGPGSHYTINLNCMIDGTSL
jgi:hypothetical protein